MLAELIPPAETLADIGADHAWLLIGLAAAGKIKNGIGVEVTAGPYRQAAANVAAAGLTGRIALRQGDGLAPLKPGEATGAALAGMGGNTIVGILARGQDIMASMAFLALQPMGQAAALRRYLRQAGWRICREAITAERGVRYQAILAQPGEMAPLSDPEAEFGPLLLREKSPLLLREIDERIAGHRRALAGLERSSSEASRQKAARIRARIKEWEALLLCLIPAGKSFDT
jgi:tRNA (adenine22-N1)-methyltransferase